MEDQSRECQQQGENTPWISQSDSTIRMAPLEKLRRLVLKAAAVNIIASIFEIPNVLRVKPRTIPATKRARVDRTMYPNLAQR